MNETLDMNETLEQLEQLAELAREGQLPTTRAFARVPPNWRPGIIGRRDNGCYVITTHFGWYDVPLTLTKKEERTT